MSDDIRESEESTPPEKAPRRAKAIWFPVLLITAGVAAVWWLQNSDLTRDVRLLQQTMVMAAMVMGCGVWFLYGAPFSRKTRLYLFAVPIIGVAIFFALFEPQHDGDMALQWNDFRFRWGQDPDEQLEVPQVEAQLVDWQSSAHDYPRFLGPDGTATIDDISLDTNWESNPPQEVWRRPIGAGWSSFAIVGPYAVTQEQRGPHEMVVCYRVADGEIVWTHTDDIRFDSSNPIEKLGGIGPRATPSIHDGKVFTHGATGIVNCLDARSGEKLWSHDTLDEFNAQNVVWGKSNSPLVLDDVVVISVGGTDGNSLVAFDVNTGEVRFSGGNTPSSYATPILTTLHRVPQIVSVDENRVTALQPTDGKVLWTHSWPGDRNSSPSVSQPVPVDGNRIFLSKGYGVGAQLIQVERSDDGTFSTSSIWKKPIMKTKFSNVVIHDGFVYGLDGGIMQCIELDTGKKQWKARRGRYGHGQLMLIGDTILISTEMDGRLVLVETNPREHQEIASFQVFAEGQKNWSNPALSGDLLLLRNAEEAVCLKLPLLPAANSEL